MDLVFSFFLHIGNGMNECLFISTYLRHCSNSGMAPTPYMEMIFPLWERKRKGIHFLYCQCVSQCADDIYWQLWRVFWVDH